MIRQLRCVWCRHLCYVRDFSSPALLGSEPRRNCQTPAQRPGPLLWAWRNLLWPRSALPAPHPHSRHRYQRVFICVEARRAPALWQLQLLPHWQCNSSACSFQRHRWGNQDCQSSCLCHQLQRSPCDERYGWSCLQQLNTVCACYNYYFILIIFILWNIIKNAELM